MRNIYIITMLQKIDKDQEGWADYGDRHSICWCNTRRKAYNILKNNKYNSREDYYNYAVIEKLPHGIRPVSLFSTFYKYNSESKTYEKIEYSDPNGVYKVFSIG